uniref:Uncharacterized protein n=1 Tax=Rhizophora mucronata TaxID=61149 RepID=A0A2P2PM66_RHIMU
MQQRKPSVPDMNFASFETNHDLLTCQFVVSKHCFWPEPLPRRRA